MSVETGSVGASAPQNVQQPSELPSEEEFASTAASKTELPEKMKAATVAAESARRVRD